MPVLCRRLEKSDVKFLKRFVLLGVLRHFKSLWTFKRCGSCAVGGYLKSGGFSKGVGGYLKGGRVFRTTFQVGGELMEPS